MADDALSPSMTADRERRRGSLARRALERVRAVMNRRINSVRNAATSRQELRNVTAVRMVEPANTTSAGPERNDIPHHVIEDLDPIRAVAAPVAPLTMRTMIEVDTDDDDDDDDDHTEEPLLPMRMGRSGMSTDKARSLFAQHGFIYEARSFRPQQEPPSKLRRVEKPIRLRVHYSCHECHRQFGVEKTCLECGHQRCQDCSREPPRRVRELSDLSRRSMQQQQQAQAQAQAHPHTQDEDARAGALAAAAPSPAVAQLPIRPAAPEMLTAPLVLDESAEYTTEALPKDYDFTMYVRPRAGIHTVWRADSRPRGQRPYHHASSLLSSSGGPDDEMIIPMVKAVKRVYRKPRQRVRYTCEDCSTLFIEGDRCHQCGHERCQNCHREPPKRAPVQHDPAVLQAVAARLAAYDQQASPSVATAAAAVAG